MRRGAGGPVAAVATVAALLLAGCAPAPAEPAGASGRTAAPAQGGALTASTNPNTPALIAQREAAGLPDCAVPPAAEPLTYGLPNVVLPCLGSTRSVNLSALRGRPLVINLWAQWCEPCREEAPALAAFARRAAGAVQVIGIDYTDPSVDKAIEFARAAGWGYPHLVDPAGVLRTRMALPGIPVTLLVAADGRIAYRQTGRVESADDLAALVSQHLGVSV